MTTAKASSSSSNDGTTLSHPRDQLQRAAELVSEMTVAEKTLLCQGEDNWRTRAIERLGVPSIMVADGPHGMRVQPVGGDHLGLSDSLDATCFPTASALAATWNPALVHEVGAAIGREARAQGVDIVLGPGANAKRSPLCGRNFEYFSEDPHLTGVMAAAHINGVQSTGAGTSLKHFVANNQEDRRLTIDAVIDERALREIYLAGFEGGVKGGAPWTLMCAYNRINGTYASDHRWLLGDVLRDEWGHTGIVMTDWGAMNDRVAAIAAGCELEMPGNVGGAPALLEQAVADGELDEQLLGRAATRLVAVALAAAANRDPHAVFDVDDHHALARRAAAEAAVLLRNDGQTLPIGTGDTVAVLGLMAAEPRFQGTGSSQINPTRVDNLRDELTGLLGADWVRWAPGHAGDEVDEEVLHQALATATDCDVAIVHVGLPDLHENEGNDRTHLRLPPSHDALVAAVAAVHDRVVVVLANGAPVEMPWVDDVDAILEGYLGGQAGAGGLADVLTGVVSPSGRLAETFPRSLASVPSTTFFPGGPRTVEYREGIWVGYRHTETVGQDVLFPFGHGLGYEPVRFGAVSLDHDAVTATALEDGETVHVTVAVANEGVKVVQQVVQVYVRDPVSTVHRPDRELKGWAKVEIQPGATVEVVIELGARAFAFWDVTGGQWFIEGGHFEVLVGDSSRDIRATAPVHVEGSTGPPIDTPPAIATPAHHLWVDAGSFAQVLGRAVPDNQPHQVPWDRNTPIGAVGGTEVGAALGVATLRAVAGDLGDDPTAAPLIRSIVQQSPLRTLVMWGVTLDQIDAIVATLNGDVTDTRDQLVRAALQRLGA